MNSKGANVGSVPIRKVALLAAKEEVRMVKPSKAFKTTDLNVTIKSQKKQIANETVDKSSLVDPDKNQNHTNVATATGKTANAASRRSKKPP